jgi:hypothetical protein
MFSNTNNFMSERKKQSSGRLARLYMEECTWMMTLDSWLNLPTIKNSLQVVELGFNASDEICKIGLVLPLHSVTPSPYSEGTLMKGQERWLFICVGMDGGIKTSYVTPQWRKSNAKAGCRIPYYSVEELKKRVGKRMPPKINKPAPPTTADIRPAVLPRLTSDGLPPARLGEDTKKCIFHLPERLLNITEDPWNRCVTTKRMGIPESWSLTDPMISTSGGGVNKTVRKGTARLNKPTSLSGPSIWGNCYAESECNSTNVPASKWIWGDSSLFVGGNNRF